LLFKFPLIFYIKNAFLILELGLQIDWNGSAFISDIVEWYCEKMEGVPLLNLDDVRLDYSVGVSKRIMIIVEGR